MEDNELDIETQMVPTSAPQQGLAVAAAAWIAKMDAVRDKRMCDLTPEQQRDAHELWIRNNLAYFFGYNGEKVTFLLERLDELRATRWNEDAERQRFEDAAHAHYLRRREERAAKGQVGILDNIEAPHERKVLFARQSNGDYVAIAYQMAWGGWKLARGGNAAAGAAA